MADYESTTNNQVWKEGQIGNKASEVESKYTKWRQNRRNEESAWYINASFVRGLQQIQPNVLNQLIVGNAPTHRQRDAINRILAKYKARQSKFLDKRPIPFIIPASGDRDDRLNAEASQKALEYILRKEQWNRKYRQILHWSNTCAKGFVWLHWDEGATANVGVPDPITGEMTDQFAQTPSSGDITFEVGSPFEVLVSDPGIPEISKQPEIMRVKLRELKDVQARYKDNPEAADIKGEISAQEVFQYQQQIATLNSRGASGYVYASTSEYRQDETKPYVIVKELFARPCSEYPQGYYCVVVGGKLLHEQMELPHGLHATNDPYPVVEFADMESVGQFWPTTVVEQMISLQRQYNLLRNKLLESIKLGAGPKMMSPMQANIGKNTWNSEPWEHIRYQWYPGLPTPQVLQMPSIATDVWNLIRLIKDEFDEVTSIYPSSQGAPGGSTSGFQTNLLQEATNSVHAPDIAIHEEAFQTLCYKVRHMMKQYYDIPRLIAITGKNMTPQVTQFSSQQIDINAEIIVQTRTALSASPAVRTQQVVELWNAEILGDRRDPKNQAKALQLIDANGIGELQEEKRRDQDLARYEIDLMNKGDTSKEPQPYEDHDAHWTVHTDFMKSFEYLGLPPEIQNLHKVHLVLHAKFIDPAKGVQLAIDLGLPELGEAMKMQLGLSQPPPQGGPHPPQSQSPGQQGAIPPPGPPSPPPPGVTGA